jgi:SAM-dependent methyltransferase
MRQTCTICQHHSYRIIYNLHSSGSIVECLNCSHTYTVIPEELDPQSLYNNDDEVYKVVENRDSVFDKILNFEYSSILNKLEKFFKTDRGIKTLLDFGCGKGKFPWLAKKKGWKAVGVETSLPRARYCKEVYGVDVITDIYNGGIISEHPFDVISLFHVLEHLPKPFELLNELVTHNLKDDGVLIIEVPNFKSTQASIGKSNWLHLDVPRHINHFTQEKLDECFKNIQLTTLKKEHFSFHLGVLGMLQSLFTIFGYKGKIIYSLKNNFTPSLFIAIICAIPFALLLEIIAASIGRGGVIRYYLGKA